MFYADFVHFKDNAVSITGVRYAHRTDGPVPDKSEYFFASLTDSRQVEVEEIQVLQYKSHIYMQKI